MRIIISGDLENQQLTEMATETFYYLCPLTNMILSYVLSCPITIQSSTFHQKETQM